MTDSSDASRKISVIVPVFNEAATIAEIVARIRGVSGYEIELIVVDDASTDGTRAILEPLRGSIDHLVLQPRNGGKGAAIRAGIPLATGAVTLIQDADLEYDPADYGDLVEPILRGQADVVFGSRFVGSKCHRVLLFWHYVCNRGLTLLSNLFTNLNLTDMETCYKAFRTPLLQSLPLREDRFGFEPEVTARVARMRARICEVGVSYYGRTYAEGKKIGAKDAIRAIYCILRYNLLP